jgi:hypothetical protein
MGLGDELIFMLVDRVVTDRIFTLTNTDHRLSAILMN